MANTPQNSESKLPDAPVAVPAKPARTRGEKLFDWITYGGLGGVGTFILTIPFADWADRKIFDSWTKGLTSTFKASETTAREIVKTTTLGLGGTVMLLPIFIAERYKKPIAEWLNQKFGNAQEKQVQIENPAPQTLGSLLKGRIVAWCAVFSGFKGMTLAGKGPALGAFEEKIGAKACEIFEKATHDKSILAAKTAAGKTEKEALAAAETITYRYGKLAALDVFATTAAISILYVTSRIFAKQRAQKAQLASEKPSVTREAVAPMAETSGAETPTLTTPQPESTISGERHAAGMVAPREMQQVHA